MPPRSVPRQVEDIIFYYYAKLIIAPSAGFRDNYRFIIDAYKRLKSGAIRMSDFERELLHICETSDICSLCGKRSFECTPIHVVSRSLGIPPGMQDLVMACKVCANSKGEKDLVEWWCKDLKKERDDLPRVPLGLYLKIAYELHKINFSLRKDCESIEEIFKILQKVNYH